MASTSTCARQRESPPVELRSLSGRMRPGTQHNCFEPKGLQKAGVAWLSQGHGPGFARDTAIPQSHLCGTVSKKKAAFFVMWRPCSGYLLAVTRVQLGSYPHVSSRLPKLGHWKYRRTSTTPLNMKRQRGQKREYIRTNILEQVRNGYLETINF